MGFFTKKSNRMDPLLEQIEVYLQSASGLQLKWEGAALRIIQMKDKKSLCLQPGCVKKILERSDQDGASFIQVNLANSKLLLTNDYIGFKPVLVSGLDPNNLPNVVTTPDLLSVFDAIIDVSTPLPNLQEADPEEAANLRLIFESILLGGEAVGFCLKEERAWPKRLTTYSAAA